MQAAVMCNADDVAMRVHARYPNRKDMQFKYMQPHVNACGPGRNYQYRVFGHIPADQVSMQHAS